MLFWGKLRSMVSDSVVKSITSRLVESFDPEKIILFGSVARGTADEHSDMALQFMKKRERVQEVMKC